MVVFRISAPSKRITSFGVSVPPYKNAQKPLQLPNWGSPAGETRRERGKGTRISWISGKIIWLGGGNSNLCLFAPRNLGKRFPILTNMFQMGWNHQPDLFIDVYEKHCHDSYHMQSHAWAQMYFQEWFVHRPLLSVEKTVLKGTDASGGGMARGHRPHLPEL